MSDQKVISEKVKELMEKWNDIVKYRERGADSNHQVLSDMEFGFNLGVASAFPQIAESYERMYQEIGGLRDQNRLLQDSNVKLLKENDELKKMDDSYLEEAYLKESAKLRKDCCVMKNELDSLLWIAETQREGGKWLKERITKVLSQVSSYKKTK